MWEFCKSLRVGRDHTISIARANQPGAWFGAGPAYLAPLSWKRSLLLDEPQQVYAWTLYNEKIGTEDWEISPEGKEELHFSIAVRSRAPETSGWQFVIPQRMRELLWLPAKGGRIIYEFSESEMNFWTVDAYNIEAMREALEA